MLNHWKASGFKLQSLQTVVSGRTSEKPQCKKMALKRRLPKTVEFREEKERKKGKRKREKKAR